jgi:D-serine deaminase-like pyridoxal phosphate-dependent protein
MRRCGIAPGEPAVNLARQIVSFKNLRFAGLQAYQGRAQHIRSMEERHRAIELAAQHVQHTKRLLAEAGIPCPRVTGAGSGTFMLEVEAGVWDEIQPGSYAFMDADYARNEWAAPLPRFEHALFVLATVMSRPSAGLAIVDAGLKASSVDSGMPVVWQREELKYTHASDEHGWIEGTPSPALGEKVLLVPGHCDPTINLSNGMRSHTARRRPPADNRQRQRLSQFQPAVIDGSFGGPRYSRVGFISSFSLRLRKPPEGNFRDRHGSILSGCGPARNSAPA